MFRNFTLYPVLAALMLASGLSAQRTAELKRNGDKAFENRRWATAKDQLSQYQEQKPGDLDVLAKLGISNYELGKGPEAKRFLEYVAAQPAGSRNPEVLYYLARTLHGLAEWEKAIAAYKSFLRVCGEKHKWRNNAADNIRRCVSGMLATENNAVALVENLGDRINTPGDEFAPLPSVNYSDRFYFASAHEGCLGGLRNDDGYEDAERGHWSSDMFAARLSNSGWESAGSLGGLLNSSRFEVPLGFNADGQILYFFRGFSTFSGVILADTASKKDEYALEPPVFTSPVQCENGDAAPFFVNDKTIIFASRRAGGQGGLDLWYTVFVDTAWTEPVNFGPSVNSAYDETTPFLAKDGRTVYFSSNRPESIGGFDVWSSVFDDRKQIWQDPESLGTPVNSPGDDLYFRLNKDGQSAFLSSNRLGGFGENDLYIAYFKEAAAAQTTLSKPQLFTQVGKDNLQLANQIERYSLPALLYSSDKDVLTGDNLKVIDQIVAIAQRHPEAGLLVTVFTDDTGQSKFDLYTGIKRAEILGKTLVQRGVSPSRVQLRSVGAAYPLARNILDGADNPEGRRLNRRIEVEFTTLDQLNFQYRLERPAVSELMAAAGVSQYDKQTNGLAFRVEAAATRQILNNDALSMFSDMMIESQAGSGSYRYLAGWFNQYDKASKLSKELAGLGFAEARVCAYINGIQVSRAEAVGLVKKYAELAAFIKG